MAAGSDGAAPYAALVLPQVQRALALLDTDPSSPTCGCFDRPFWHYRTLVDFPGATWQQLVWPLALIHGRAGADNPFAGDARLLDAVDVGLRWWTRIQHRDGSFDEWYRNEHSYCPTAFTLAAACEALLILGNALPEATRAAALAAAERAGAWLERRFNGEVMNQNLAAALALWDLASLTRDERWRRAAKSKYARVAAAQHAEGWLPEYGGADLGYSTLALDLLAAADTRGAGAHVHPIAARLASFLLQVQGVGPGHAGRLGSRGTAHVFPYGAEHFAASIREAAALAQQWRRDHAAGLQGAPADVDDRYFAYFHLPHFALAWAAATRDVAAPPQALPPVVQLPGAGLVVVRRLAWSVSVSTRLGGALAIQQHTEPPAYQLGYAVGLAGGGSLVSHHADAASGPPEVSEEAGIVTVRVRARFAQARRSQPLVRWGLPFRAFTALLAFGRAAETFQAAVKRRRIHPRAKAGIELTRIIVIAAQAVEVHDEIRLLDRRLRIVSLQPVADIALHSPSARQDRGTPVAVPLDPDAGVQLKRCGRLTIDQRIPMRDGC